MTWTISMTLSCCGSSVTGKRVLPTARNTCIQIDFGVSWDFLEGYTHLGRYTEQANQYVQGVSDAELRRWTCRVHNPEDANYLHVVPTPRNLAIGAGGNEKCIDDFVVPRMAALQTLSEVQMDDLINDIFPGFVNVSPFNIFFFVLTYTCF